MFALPHMMVGAAAGKVLKRPWLVVPVALGTHFLLDYVPHLDAHSLFGVKGAGPTSPEAATAVLDFLVGCALVGWLALRHPRVRWAVVLGAFAGIIIDLVDNVPPWSGWFRASSLGSAISAFHHGFQNNLTRSQWLAGFATQIAVTVLALFYLLRRPHRKTGDSRFP